jgi:hypothetical protein
MEEVERKEVALQKEVGVCTARCITLAFGLGYCTVYSSKELRSKHFPANR